MKAPLVIAYRQAALTWHLMRRMLYLPYVGLPNILAGERLVDEFLQEQATPESSRAPCLRAQRPRASAQTDRATREIHAACVRARHEAADTVLLDGTHGRRAA